MDYRINLKHAGLGLFVFLLGCQGETNTEADIQPKMYQEQSGFIHSETRIGRAGGEPSILDEYLFWDDWGLKLAKYQRYRNGETGTKTVMRYHIKDGKFAPEKIALIDLPSGESEIKSHPMAELFAAIEPSEFGDIATAFMKRGNRFIKTDETREYDGRTCVVWKSKLNDQHTNCYWQGLILETVMDQPDFDMINNKKAVEVALRPVAADHFEIPGRLDPVAK